MLIASNKRGSHTLTPPYLLSPNRKLDDAFCFIVLQLSHLLPINLPEVNAVRRRILTWHTRFSVAEAWDDSSLDQVDIDQSADPLFQIIFLLLSLSLLFLFILSFLFFIIFSLFSLSFFLVISSLSFSLSLLLLLLSSLFFSSLFVIFPSFSLFFISPLSFSLAIHFLSSFSFYLFLLPLSLLFFIFPLSF